MRLALCNEVLRERLFAHQCALAAALGYGGLEVAPFTLDAGIAITGLHWLLVTPKGLSITSADQVLRARTLDVMQRLIGLAADLGAGYLVHGSPAQRQVAGPDDAARAEAALAQAADWAADAGVTYCLEPLSPRETNWAVTVEEAVGIVRRIGSPALRTMLDVCAAGQGEAAPVVEVLERFLPTGLLAHIHLNDRNRRAPGQGEDRFGPILAALRRHGYAGWCGVEPFEYLPDGAGSAAFAAGYLRGVAEAGA